MEKAENGMFVGIDYRGTLKAGESLTFEIEVVGISDTPAQASAGCGCGCDCFTDCRRYITSPW